MRYLIILLVCCMLVGCQQKVNLKKQMYLMEDGDILYTQIGYEGLLIAPTPKKRFLIMRFSEENWKRYKNGEKIKVEIFFEVK